MSQYYDEYDGEVSGADTDAHIPYEEYLAKTTNQGGAEQSAPAPASNENKELTQNVDTEFSKAADVDQKLGQSKLTSDTTQNAQLSVEGVEEESKGMFGKLRDSASNFANKVKNGVKSSASTFGKAFSSVKGGVASFGASMGISTGAAAGVIGVGGGSIVALIVSLLIGGNMHVVMPSSDCAFVPEKFYENSEYKPPEESQMKGTAQSIYKALIKDADEKPYVSAEAIAGLCSNAIGESSLQVACYEMWSMVGPTDGPSNHDMILSRSHHVNWPLYTYRMFVKYDEQGVNLSHGTYYYIPVGTMLFNNGEDMIYTTEVNGEEKEVNLGAETLTISYQDHLNIITNTYAWDAAHSSFTGQNVFNSTQRDELTAVGVSESDAVTCSYSYYDEDGVTVKHFAVTGFYVDAENHYPLAYPGVGLWQWTGARAFELQRFGDRDVNPTDANGDLHSDSMYTLNTQLAFLKVENCAGCFADPGRYDGKGKLTETPTYQYNSSHMVYDILSTTDKNGRKQSTSTGATMTSFGDFNTVQTTEAAQTEATSNGFVYAVYGATWQNTKLTDRHGNVTYYFGDDLVSSATTPTWWKHANSVTTADAYHTDGTIATNDTTYDDVSEIFDDASAYSGSNYATVLAAAGHDWSGYVPEPDSDCPDRAERGEPYNGYTYPYIDGYDVTLLPTDVIERHIPWETDQMAGWLPLYNTWRNTQWTINWCEGTITGLNSKITTLTGQISTLESQIADLNTWLNTASNKPGSEPQKSSYTTFNESGYNAAHDAWSTADPATRGEEPQKSSYETFDSTAYNNAHNAWAAKKAAYDAKTAEKAAKETELTNKKKEKKDAELDKAHWEGVKAGAEAVVDAQYSALLAYVTPVWAGVDEECQLRTGGSVAIEQARWFANYWEGCPNLDTHLNNASVYYRYSVEEEWGANWTPTAYNNVIEIIDENITDIRILDMYRSIFLTQCGGSDLDNSSTAAWAVNWAYPGNIPCGDRSEIYYDIDATDTEGGIRTQAQCTSLYVACVLIVNPSEWIMSSCDRGYMCAARASGLDDNFPPGACKEQRQYVMKSPKWAYVCSINSEADFALCEPGDLIINDHHTMTFTGITGAEVAMEKWPDLGYTLENAKYSICHSSLGDRGVRFDAYCAWVIGGNDNGPFEVYRCVDPDGDSSKCKQAIDANLNNLEMLPNGSVPCSPGPAMWTLPF